MSPGFEEDGALDQPGHGGKLAHGLATFLRGLGRIKVGLGLLGHVHADGAQPHEPGLAAGGVLRAGDRVRGGSVKNEQKENIERGQSQAFFTAKTTKDTKGACLAPTAERSGESQNPGLCRERGVDLESGFRRNARELGMLSPKSGNEDFGLSGRGYPVP